MHRTATRHSGLVLQCISRETARRWTTGKFRTETGTHAHLSARSCLCFSLSIRSLFSRRASCIAPPTLPSQPAAASSRSASSGVDGGGPALLQESTNANMTQAHMLQSRKSGWRSSVTSQLCPVVSLVLQHSGLPGASCDGYSRQQRCNLTF
jgi:hypothetical protein